MTAKETVKAICEALIEKKAQGIEVLHVERLTELTEYFVTALRPPLRRLRHWRTM